MIDIMSDFMPGLSAIGGFLGSVASHVMGERAAAAEHKRNMDEQRFQWEVAQAQGKFDAAEAIRQHERDQNAWNWEGLKQSLEHDQSIKTSEWVSDFRGIVRPAVTVGSLMFMGVGSLFGLEPLPILQNVAMLSVSWWFGSRTIENSSPRVYSRSDYRRTVGV